MEGSCVRFEKFFGEINGESNFKTLENEAFNILIILAMVIT